GVGRSVGQALPRTFLVPPSASRASPSSASRLRRLRRPPGLPLRPGRDRPFGPFFLPVLSSTCSVETLRSGQDHEGVSQHPHQDLALLVRPAPRPQGRTEQPLVPRESALDLPPLAEDPAVPRAPRLLAEPLGHLPPVAGPRPLPPGVPPVQRDDRRADA